MTGPLLLRTLAALAAVPGAAWPGGTGEAIRACVVDPDPPEYYAIDLVTTRNIPGTGYTRGQADVTYRPSPFVVSVDADGSYTYDVRVSFENLKAPRGGGRYVAWVTTPELDETVRIGELDGAGRATGRVAWNKFIVVVSYEGDPDPAADRWTGPIAFRGMSRSGRMHTMIGHGPLQDEKCAAYGYAN